MSPRPFITAAFLFAAGVIRSILAAEGELGTFPAVPESGKGFQVLHHKDVAAAKLAAEEKVPPAEIKYKWMVTVSDGKHVFRPTVSGVPLKPASAPNLKVTKAKPGTTYTFILHRTDSNADTWEHRLVVEFGPEGSEAKFPEPVVPPPPPPGAGPPGAGAGGAGAGAPDAGAGAPDAGAGAPDGAGGAGARAPGAGAGGVGAGGAGAGAPGAGAPGAGAGGAGAPGAGAAAAGAAPAAALGTPESFQYTVQEFNVTNPGTIIQSLDQLDAKVRKFVSNPVNHIAGPVPAGFFDGLIKKRYAISANKSLSVAGAQVQYPLLFAALVSAKMHDVEKQEPDDTALRNTWNTELEQLFKDSRQGATPVLEREQETVWRQFLAEWNAEVVSKGTLRNGLKQAPYELLAAFIGFNVATSTPSGPQAQNPSNQVLGAGNMVTGGYSPFHERRMNHIYHHHYHQMNKVARIRARR